MQIITNNMMCKHCVKRVETALKNAGATKLDVKINDISVEGVLKEQIIDIIEDLGFEVVEIKE